MSTMRCCSTWKLPIGCPNCWRCLAVFDGVGQHLSHAADRLGADRRGAFVARLVERRPRLALVAEQRVAGQPQPVEHDVGGAPVVDRAVGVHLDARTRVVELDEEQRDARWRCAR